MNNLPHTTFVAFDTETTGLFPSKDKIIELGAVRFVDGAPTEIFETFVDPQMPIPPKATSISHIDDAMVKGAPTIAQVLPAFEAFVGQDALVAHNLEFDLGFLFHSGSRVMDGKRKFYDTLALAGELLKKSKNAYGGQLGLFADDEDDYDVLNYKLATLCDYYNITTDAYHRAAGDALATGKLFLALMAEKQTRSLL